MKKIVLGIGILVICCIAFGITQTELNSIVDAARKEPKENIAKLAEIAESEVSALTPGQKRVVYRVLISGYYTLKDSKNCCKFSILQLKDEKLPLHLKYDALFFGGISAGNSGDLIKGCEMFQNAVVCTNNKNQKISAMVQLIFLQVKSRNFEAAEKTVKDATAMAEEEDRMDWLARINFAKAILIDRQKGKTAWVAFIEKNAENKELLQYPVTILLCKYLLKYYVRNKHRADAETLAEKINQATENKHAAQFAEILK